MKLFQVWAATFLGDISQDFAKCGLQLFQGVLILHCSVIGQRQRSLIGLPHPSALSLVTTGLSLVKLLLVPNYHWSTPALSHWSPPPQCSLIGHHWSLIGQIVIGPKLSLVNASALTLVPGLCQVQ